MTLLATAAPVVASAHSGTRLHLSGTWAGTVPLTFTSQSQDGSMIHARFNGVTTWGGALAGTTSFTGHGSILTQQGRIIAYVDETFTGSVAGVGTGTLVFEEQLRQDAVTGAVTVDAQIVRGTGQLRGLRGHVFFVGFSDANGIGGGTYTSRLVVAD